MAGRSSLNRFHFGGLPEFLPDWSEIRGAGVIMSNVKKVGEVYKCGVCGNIIEVNHVGGGELICCGQPMELLVEKTKDIGAEKHVPVIEKIENGVLVKVGLIPHPMEEKHFIEWIEIANDDGKSYKTFLKPDDKPEAEFSLKHSGDITARIYCNIHGLWKSLINIRD